LVAKDDDAGPPALFLEATMARLRSRRWLLAILSVIVFAGIFLGWPGYLWVEAYFNDKPVPHVVPSEHVDDASRLNNTRVAEVWSIPADRTAAESQLRELLHRAREQGLKVAIGGAGHSMGGHAIFPDGVVLNMLPFNHLELDAGQHILTAGAGARWAKVIPYLDARGFSAGIMQSNNNFSVGGSVSVNCHGWQHDRPPIASTVVSLRLMKADGTVVRCSRSENAELFSLVLGGYGLFGVILDVELRVVPNERYRPEIEVLPAEQYVSRFSEKVRGAADIGMVYGRLCIVPGEKTFLREAILTVFRRAPCKKEEIPSLKSAGLRTLRREVFRAQIGSTAGKKVRWKVEKTVGQQISRKHFARNQLFNEEAEVYQEHDADRTDILHEYFIPPDKVPKFLEAARQIIPRHHGELLNVTIRNVLEDNDTFLRYADRDMFAFVMLFNQPRTHEADEKMETMTRELIDASIACGGRHYLPYRLHATRDQLLRAYPRAAAFFASKRRYDPDEVFQNQFYSKYEKQ
jgi:FAD/FMN-containing dehydrogenase